MIIPSFKYFILTLKHKWFVLLAGLRIGCPVWRLILHDWTKFLPSELPHYGRQFLGASNDPLGYVTCWLRHQNRNCHHWEYWIPRTGHTHCNPPFQDNMPIPMPLHAVREMVADWFGASRAYEGQWPDLNSWKWFEDNKCKMQLHPLTSMRLDSILDSLRSLRVLEGR